jgi:hypothetical protein
MVAYRGRLGVIRAAADWSAPEVVLPLADEAMEGLCQNRLEQVQQVLAIRSPRWRGRAGLAER